MPFNTSAATAAQNALAIAAKSEQSERQLSLIKTGVLVLIVLFLVFLAWRASRRAKKRKALNPAELQHLEDMQAALDQQRLAELNSSIPTPALQMAASREEEAREERQREIEQMVEDQPEEMAALLRGWLGAGR